MPDVPACSTANSFVSSTACSPVVFPILQVKGLSKDFNHGLFHSQTVHAVREVSFSMEKGKTFGLLGNSGCGKTTICRMLMNLIPPTAGQVLYEGADIASFDRQKTKDYHRQVQMIFQNPEASLDPSKRIVDSFLEAMKLHGLFNNKDEGLAKITEQMNSIGLPEPLLYRFPHQVSGGEAQRLIICRALLLSPSVLILDEPTSMLDVSVQARIMHMLKELQQELGLTYLYITHDVELLRWISQDIGVMHQGELVEAGSCESVLESPQHPYTKQLLQSFFDW